MASSGWLGVDATQTPLRTGRRKPWRGLSHPMASSLDRISAEIPVSEWRAAPYQPGVTRRRSGTTEASDHRPRTRVARNQLERAPRRERDFAPLRGAGSGGGSTGGAKQHLPRNSETHARPAPAGASKQLAHTPPASGTRPAVSAPLRRRAAHRRRAETSGLVADSRNRATRNGHQPPGCDTSGCWRRLGSCAFRAAVTCCNRSGVAARTVQGGCLVPIRQPRGQEVT